MAFPFLFLSLSLTAGILLSYYLSPSLPTLAVLLGVNLASAWAFFFFKKNKTSLVFLLLATLFLGGSFLVLANNNFEQNSLHTLNFKDYIDFYGTLTKSPSPGRDKYFLLLKVEKASFQKKEINIKGNLRITVFHSSQSSLPKNLLVGDKIKVSARLTSSHGFRNFNKPSLSLYLKTQKIHNRAFTKSPLLVEKIKTGKKYSILRAISLLRQKFQQKIETHFSSSQAASLSPQGAVLEALLLGERTRMSNSISRSLQTAGIYHLLAISGAHIAIISFLFFSLLRLARIPERASYILLMSFLVFFALLVEGRPSVMRATIMALAYLLGKVIWSDINLINTISISAFFLLLANPFSLFNVGFQLTFAATLSIILFFPKIIKYFPRLPLRISEIFCLSLTAQLGIIPIIAAVFHRVTFSSLLLNYAALPLVAVIMASGYIFLVLSFFSFWLSHLLANFIYLSINLLIGASHGLDWLSFSSYRLPAPHLLTIIAYFSLLLLLLIPLKARKQKILLSFCFMAVFFILIYYPFSSSSHLLKLTVLDVGQGESILVEFPGRKKMLIDGGGLQQETFDIGENVVSPFLWKKGIKKIDYLVLTHAHPDHLNGLRAVARNFKIKELWEALSPLENKTYEEFKNLLPPSTHKKRIFRGDRLQQDLMTIDVLHPVRQNPFVSKVDNDQSLVLRLSYGQTSFLLTGDISREAEREILKAGLKLQSQVLKSPHHGSNSSSSKAFLERAKPQIIIISAGEGNRYGFPEENVLARYEQLEAKVYRTDLDGAVEASSDGRKISIRTSIPRHSSKSLPYSNR